MKNRFFEVKSRDEASQARVGEIKTDRGVIETPCFIPDATYGAVKHLTAEDLSQAGLQMILGNIYHLRIRPGTEVIQKLGGLQQLMNWEGPILTDSGGWQVFSLIYQYGMGQVKKEGIEYKDHLTGQKHWLTPETCLQDQLDIGSDILMILDYPVDAEAKENENRYSVSTTIRWAKKAKIFYDQHPKMKEKMMMAIIQGANDKKMRKKCFDDLEGLWPWPGYGFGGPTVNDEIIGYTAKLIPEDRLRYLMGAGPPEQVVRSIAQGWDLFDCVIPTRNARHGLAYTFSGPVKIYQKKYELDNSPIEEGCPCLACRGYTRAYLRHLIKIDEPVGKRLMTVHNLTFYMRLMEKIRQDIKAGQFQPDRFLDQLENSGN